MKTFKKILSLLPLLVLWAMMSVFLWGFVFDKLTDTAPEHKITLCVDAEVPRTTDLAVALEEGLNGAVRMVKVRPFSYAMFDSGTLTGADLFIVPASHLETYRDWFAPLPEAFAEEKGALLLDSVPYGLLAYDPETGVGLADAYIDYLTPGQEPEAFYLLFGKESLHVRGHENAVDDAAVTAARLLLSMEQ